jgi:putative transposase
MTTPRCIRAGTTWFVTRRTTRRHFLLRPDEDCKLQEIYWYATAVIAAETGIELHAVQVLSTHIHEVLTDTRGELPRFLQQRNRLLANAIKCHRGWPEEVFARAPTGCVALYGAAAIEKEIGYTLANCVEAGLVARPEDWPGVTITREGLGRAVIRVARPSAYFDPNNSRWPAEAELRVTLPETLVATYGSQTDARNALSRAVDAAVSVARAAAAKAGRFVGRLIDLVRVPFHRRAASHESFGRRVPSFAAAGAPDAARRAKVERASFLSKYRTALDALRRREDEALFPYGAWRLCREFGAAVEQASSLADAA